MKRLLIIPMISGFMVGAMFAQSPSGLLAPSRYIDWSHAGATIATRTTQCGSTISAGASAATIQAAITACAGTNQYVLLGSGTFSLPSSLVVTYAGALNVTLRGSGPTNTILKFTGTSTNCNGIGATAVCITNGDSSNTANGSANTLNWTAGYSAGTTVLTAGSAVTGSLANMHVGTLLYLTEADIGSDNGQWWPCGSTGFNGACSEQGMENQWPARSTSQIVTVTNISGSSITVSPGVYAPDYASGRTPYMSFSSYLPISGFGLENLTVDTQSVTGSSQAAMVEYGWALNCWIKNVSLINSVNPGGAMHKHVFIGSSAHVTVRDSYMYGSSPTMEGYGVDNTLGTSDSLIENNISNHVATAFMFESTAGNVLGYNFVTDNFYVGNPPGSAPNWQGSDISFHDAGNYYNLVEGHEGIQFSSDDIHGTAFANTLFRSYMNGRDPATQCPGGGNACGTGAKNQDTQAVQIMANNRYFNLVANVLGTSSYFNTYQQQGATGSPNSCPSTNWTSIYNLNYGASWLTPWSPACGNGSSWTIDNDDKVSSSLMRWGNYDTVNGSVQTNSSEKGNTASTYPGLSSPSTTWGSYPSLYYASTPSWWDTTKVPWPPIGPDVTGGNIANVGGFANDNLAGYCYKNVFGGKIDGSTGIIPFDAALCPYTGSGTPTAATPTASPTSGTPPQSVTLSDTTPSSTIYYTIDGSTPTTSSTVYSGAISISTNPTTLKAIATASGYLQSAMANWTYSGSGTAGTPVFSPSGGTQPYGTVISISTTPSICNPYIYWARNTTPPTTGDVNGTGGPVYSSATFYAKVIGCPTYADSAVGSATYTIASTYTLTVSASGSGTVGGANCSTGTYASGTSVTCTPSPAAGSYFAGWGGGTCLGTGTCSFSLSGNSTVTAQFNTGGTQLSGQVVTSGQTGVQ